MLCAAGLRYEWVTVERGKQPYFIHRRDKRPFAIAGLWEQGGDGHCILSCALLTTETNPFMQPLHTRMPAILAEGDEAAWLDPSNHNSEELHALLQPLPNEVLNAYPVSRRVNDPKNDDDRCLEPI